MNDYDPVELVKDATRFKRSRFGQHFLKKLHDRIAEASRAAVDLRLTREERADWGIVAAEAQRQLDYFNTAERTASSPKLLKQMADGFKRRMKGEKATSV